MINRLAKIISVVLVLISIIFPFALVLIAIIYPTISLFYAKEIQKLNNRDLRKEGINFSYSLHRSLQLVTLSVIIVMFHDAFYECFTWLPRGGRYEDGVWMSYREIVAYFFTVITGFPLAFILLMFVPSLIVSKNILLERLVMAEEGGKDKEISNF